MTWRRFWELGRQGSDHLFTAAITMFILRTGGYLHIDWWYIVYWAVFSAVFGIVMVMCAAFCEPTTGREEVE